MVRWSGWEESGDFDCQWFVPGARLVPDWLTAWSRYRIQVNQVIQVIQVNLNQVQLGEVHTFDLYRCFMGIFGFTIGSTD